MPHEVLKGKHLLDGFLGPYSEAESLAAHLKNVVVGTPEYERLKIIKKDVFHRFTLLPASATDQLPVFTPVVRYNFQHDLESLWWLVIFYINACVDHQRSQDYAEDVFHNSMIATWQRTDCFEKNYIFDGGRFLHPKLVGSFKHVIEDLRRTMVEEYVAREAFGQLNQFETYSYIHAFFAKQFRTLLQHNADGWKDVLILGSKSSDTKGAGAITGKRGRVNSNAAGSATNKKARHVAPLPK